MVLPVFSSSIALLIFLISYSACDDGAGIFPQYFQHICSRESFEVQVIACAVFEDSCKRMLLKESSQILKLLIIIYFLLDVVGVLSVQDVLSV